MPARPSPHPRPPPHACLAPALKAKSAPSLVRLAGGAAGPSPFARQELIEARARAAHAHSAEASALLPLLSAAVDTQLRRMETKLSQLCAAAAATATCERRPLARLHTTRRRLLAPPAAVPAASLVAQAVGVLPTRSMSTPADRAHRLAAVRRARRGRREEVSALISRERDQLESLRHQVRPLPID